MIVYTVNGLVIYETRADKPAQDWTGKAEYILDDRDPADAELIGKIKALAPFLLLTTQDGRIVDAVDDAEARNAWESTHPSTPNTWQQLLEAVNELRNTGLDPSMIETKVAAAVGKYLEENPITGDSAVSSHNTSQTAHSDIRLLVSDLAERLNALADSDDVTLDQLSEIVAFIKSNKTLIESITSSKVSVTDIIDNLSTNVSDRPLSAKMGMELKRLIDSIELPTLDNLSILNIKGVTNVPSEYNLYVLANTVPTWDEFLASEGLSLIKGYRTTFSNNTIAYEENYRYHSIKIPVAAGDVIRFKLMPYYQFKSNGVNFIFLHNSITGVWSKVSVGFGATAEKYDIHNSDLASNGFTVPNDVDYLIADIFYRYYLSDGTFINTDSAYGETDYPTYMCEVVTRNMPASYTSYDNAERCPIYTGSNIDGYYMINDDLRITRYENMLGDVESVLSEVVGEGE